MSDHFDVIIIGTGAGGGTLLHTLAPSGRRILVLDQRQQEMLERRIFMVTLVGERQRAMERLFEAARKTGHSRSLQLYWSLHLYRAGSVGITSFP